MKRAWSCLLWFSCPVGDISPWVREFLVPPLLHHNDTLMVILLHSSLPKHDKKGNYVFNYMELTHNNVKGNEKVCLSFFTEPVVSDENI